MDLTFIPGNFSEQVEHMEISLNRSNTWKPVGFLSCRENWPSLIEQIVAETKLSLPSESADFAAGVTLSPLPSHSATFAVGSWRVPAGVTPSALASHSPTFAVGSWRVAAGMTPSVLASHSPTFPVGSW